MLYFENWSRQLWNSAHYLLLKEWTGYRGMFYSQSWFASRKSFYGSVVWRVTSLWTFEGSHHWGHSCLTVGRCFPIFHNDCILVLLLHVLLPEPASSKTVLNGIQQMMNKNQEKEQACDFNWDKNRLLFYIKIKSLG